MVQSFGGSVTTMVVLEEGAVEAVPQAQIAVAVGPPARRVVRYPLEWRSSFYPLIHGLYILVFLAALYGFYQISRDVGFGMAIVLGIIALVFFPCTTFFAQNGRCEKQTCTMVPSLAVGIGCWVTLALVGQWCPVMDRNAAVIHGAVYHPPTRDLSTAIREKPLGPWVLDSDVPDRAVFSIPPQAPDYIGFAINDSAVVFVIRLPPQDTPFPALPFPTQSDGRLWLTNTPAEWRPALFWIQQDLQTRFTGRDFTSFLVATDTLSQYHNSRSMCIPSFHAFLVFASLTFAWILGLQLVILFKDVSCR